MLLHLACSGMKYPYHSTHLRGTQYGTMSMLSGIPELSPDRPQVTALSVIQVGETGILPANVQFTIDDPNDVQPSVRTPAVSAVALGLSVGRAMMCEMMHASRTLPAESDCSID